MPRFAANITMMFTERPLLDRFAAAAEAGFAAVEAQFLHDHAPETVAARLAAAGLELALFNAAAGDFAAGDRGLAALPHRRAELDDAIARSLDMAAATGCRRLHMMAGIAEPGDAAAAASYADAVAEAAERLGAAGLELMLEPINRRDMPGYFLCGFPQAEAAIAAAGRANVKLQFDLYHRQIMHGDVIEGLRGLAPITGHVQIAGAPERREPDTGELDHRRVLAALDATGYAGWVGCEYRPRGRTEDGLGWLAPYRAAGG